MFTLYLLKIATKDILVRKQGSLMSQELKCTCTYNLCTKYRTISFTQFMLSQPSEQTVDLSTIALDHRPIKR